MDLKGSKSCTKCGQIKTFKEFSKASHHKLGLGSWCKNCKNERTKQIYHSNITHARSFRSNWRKNNPGYDLKKYWPTLSSKERHIKFNAMHESQKGLCKICSKPEKHIHHKSGKIRNLSVDHCHRTGVIRGLLCSECNRALGAFRDNPSLIQRVFKYLKTPRH